MLIHLSILILVIGLNISPLHSQSGPDPWHTNSPSSYEINDEAGIPPDIRMPVRKKIKPENVLGIGEWFFKRTLALMLRGGQNKNNEDGSVDISLQMKFDSQQWETLDECLKSDTPLSEEMYRRTLGYVEDSIYKPSFAEQIVLEWSEYIKFYLMEYMNYISWGMFALGVAAFVFWLLYHMSHRQAIIIIFILFYAYEVFISYKEAEQKELEKFLTAMDKCKWYFWTSKCDMPTPDPLVFIKYMNPMRIGMRMFTTALAEPFIAISNTAEVILHGVTDGLWYPFDKITYAIIIVLIKISLIYFLIMIIFNWLLNIPFHFGFLGFGINLKQRNRTIIPNKTQDQPIAVEDNTDRISQATLDRILNVCSLALTSNAQSSNVPNGTQAVASSSGKMPTIKRSASTGRLPDRNSFASNNEISLRNVKRRNNLNVKVTPQDGSGDWH